MRVEAKRRAAAIALTVGAAAWAGHWVAAASGIGYPDGHRTAFDRAAEIAWPIFAAVGAGMGLAGLLAAWRARPAIRLAFVCAVLAAGCHLIDRALRALLDTGGGG